MTGNSPLCNTQCTEDWRSRDLILRWAPACEAHAGTAQRRGAALGTGARLPRRPLPWFSRSRLVPSRERLSRPGLGKSCSRALVSRPPLPRGFRVAHTDTRQCCRAHDSCLKSPCIAHVPDKGPAGSPGPRQKAGSACWQRGGRGSAEGRDWQKPPELRDV